MIWIVRKHPPMPYKFQRGHLAAFTIHSAHESHASAAEQAKVLNGRSVIYFYSVGKVQLKEKRK